MRKVIQLTALLCDNNGLMDWRQHAYNVKQVKKHMRNAQMKKRASGKTENQKAKKEKCVKEAHNELIKVAQKYLDKSEQTLKTVESLGALNVGALGLMESIIHFTQHAIRQIDQIKRRVLQGEVIRHEEKVFSVFQPHTEWVSKGKAGVPVEFGVRVCIMEDQHQFILHHRVMEKEIDVQIAVTMVLDTQGKFPELRSCSFDKGFHSPENQEKLKEILDEVGMKRKGKRTQKAKEEESTEVFKKAQHKHSAVESAINALEVHGLDKCKDHGIDGFKCYVALSIVTRNIHRIGDILHKRLQKQLARISKRSHSAPLKLAA